MTDSHSEFIRMINALETFSGKDSFFQSLVPAFKKADPVNRVILLEAFKKMHRSEHYLPGGFHYEDDSLNEETTPIFTKMNVLDELEKETNKWAEKNLGIKL